MKKAPIMSESNCVKIFATASYRFVNGEYNRMSQAKQAIAEAQRDADHQHYEAEHQKELELAKEEVVKEIEKLEKECQPDFTKLGTKVKGWLMAKQVSAKVKLNISGSPLSKGTINQTVIVKDIEGDMGEKSHIQLIMQPDGDVILCFYNPEKNFIDSIEFCSSNGGGKNPVIAKKLRELINELTFKAGK